MPLDIPPAWRAAFDRIVAEAWRTVLVLGATDVGKSAFCRGLVGHLIAAGRAVVVVDADIGQKDVGAPATVSRARPRSSDPADAWTEESLYFVGGTSPIGRMLPLALGTARLAAEAETGATVVVNTTGLVHGAGRTLKQFKIDALDPDGLVALEREGELETLIRANRFRSHIRLAPSAEARAKSAAERRRLRQQAFGRYFASARRQPFDVGELCFQRTLLFGGERIDAGDSLHAERGPEGTLVVRAAAAAQGDHRLLPAGAFRHLLCGVADGSGRCVGLGIIETIDFRAGTLVLMSPVPRAGVRVLQIGDLHLGPDGEELGRPPWADGC